jgi:hypothetical protein
MRFSTTSFSSNYLPRIWAMAASAIESQWWGWLAAMATRTRSIAKVLMIRLLDWIG